MPGIDHTAGDTPKEENRAAPEQAEEILARAQGNAEEEMREDD